MINSYASEIGKDLYQGNWNIFPGQLSLDLLDDCFIDLRILDAAAVETDIQRAFRGRIVKLENGGSRSIYVITQPADCAVGYSIEFQWSGSNAEAVDVRLSSIEGAIARTR